MDKDQAIRNFLIGVLAGFVFEYFRTLIEEVRLDLKEKNSRSELCDLSFLGRLKRWRFSEN